SAERFAEAGCSTGSSGAVGAGITGRPAARCPRKKPTTKRTARPQTRSIRKGSDIGMRQTKPNYLYLGTSARDMRSCQKKVSEYLEVGQSLVSSKLLTPAFVNSSEVDWGLQCSKSDFLILSIRRVQR